MTHSINNKMNMDAKLCTIIENGNELKFKSTIMEKHHV